MVYDLEPLIVSLPLPVLDDPFTKKQIDALVKICPQITLMGLTVLMVCS
jgi:hypothetical protein